MIKNTSRILNDCLLIDVNHFYDDRGTFTKFYSHNIFKELFSNIKIKEQFYTVSRKNVIRGMHFQSPPHQHDKLVTCISGKAIDVVLDLRTSSKTYGNFESFELNANKNSVIFIPAGFAHGFLSLEDNTCLLYGVSSIHSPKNDKGILWNSFGFNWPCKNPIISKRDKNQLALNNYSSDFK